MTAQVARNLGEDDPKHAVGTMSVDFDVAAGVRGLATPEAILSHVRAYLLPALERVLEDPTLRQAEARVEVLEVDLGAWPDNPDWSDVSQVFCDKLLSALQPYLHYPTHQATTGASPHRVSRELFGVPAPATGRFTNAPAATTKQKREDARAAVTPDPMLRSLRAFLAELNRVKRQNIPVRQRAAISEVLRVLTFNDEDGDALSISVDQIVMAAAEKLSFETQAELAALLHTYVSAPETRASYGKQRQGQSKDTGAAESSANRSGRQSGMPEADVARAAGSADPVGQSDQPTGVNAFSGAGHEVHLSKSSVEAGYRGIDRRIGTVLTNRLEMIAMRAEELAGPLARVIVQSGKTPDDAERQAHAIAPHIAAHADMRQLADKASLISEAKTREPAKSGNSGYDLSTGAMEPDEAVSDDAAKAAAAAPKQAPGAGGAGEETFDMWRRLLVAIGHSDTATSVALSHLKELVSNDSRNAIFTPTTPTTPTTPHRRRGAEVAPDHLPPGGSEQKPAGVVPERVEDTSEDRAPTQGKNTDAAQSLPVPDGPQARPDPSVTRPDVKPRPKGGKDVRASAEPAQSADEQAAIARRDGAAPGSARSDHPLEVASTPPTSPWRHAAGDAPDPTAERMDQQQSGSVLRHATDAPKDRASPQGQDADHVQRLSELDHLDATDPTAERMDQQQSGSIPRHATDAPKDRASAQRQDADHAQKLSDPDHLDAPAGSTAEHADAKSRPKDREDLGASVGSVQRVDTQADLTRQDDAKSEPSDPDDLPKAGRVTTDGPQQSGSGDPKNAEIWRIQSDDPLEGAQDLRAGADQPQGPGETARVVARVRDALRSGGGVDDQNAQAFPDQTRDDGTGQDAGQEAPDQPEILATLLSLVEALEAENGTHWRDLFDLVWRALPTSQVPKGHQADLPAHPRHASDEITSRSAALDGAPNMFAKPVLQKNAPSGTLSQRPNGARSPAFDPEKPEGPEHVQPVQPEKTDPLAGQLFAPDVADETPAETAEAAYLQAIMALVMTARGPDDRFETFLQERLVAMFPDPQIRRNALRQVVARLSYSDGTFSPVLRRQALAAVEILLSQSVAPKHSPATTAGTQEAHGPMTAPGPDGQSFLSQRGGLVLFHPFLPLLFDRLKLLDDKRQIPKANIPVARRALQLIGDTQALEEQPTDPVEKMLLGVPQNWAMPLRAQGDPPDAQLINSLLQSVIARWGALGETSVDGLREAFICRNASLQSTDDGWRLHVDSGPFDMLLDRLPWSFGTVGLPWMPAPCHVIWRESHV